MHYLPQGLVDQGAELFRPCKEAYEMLKGAVVGGQSLVFTHYQEVGETEIRSYQKAKLRRCKRILGYKTTHSTCQTRWEIWDIVSANADVVCSTIAFSCGSWTVIKAVYRTIEYQPTKIITWFVEQVREAHRTSDVNKSKALLAQVFKMLGNSDYRKLPEALEWEKRDLQNG